VLRGAKAYSGARRIAVAAVSVEVEEVVVAGMALEMGAKLVEGGWAQDIDVSPELQILRSAQDDMVVVNQLQTTTFIGA